MILNMKHVTKLVICMCLFCAVFNFLTNASFIQHHDINFQSHTVDQCFGQTIPVRCEPGAMVEVSKVYYKQARHCHGSFHSNICSREETSNPACVGNQTCVFTTPYIYISPECGYSNNFELTYKCIPGSEPLDICLETVTTKPSGYIISPNYPSKYPPSKTCKITIVTGKDKIIKVYLLDLFLAYYNYDITKQCVDFLWVAGPGDEDRTHYLCSGRHRGLIYTSRGNKATIYFTSKSQAFLNAKGFWIYYEAVRQRKGNITSTVINTNQTTLHTPYGTTPMITEPTTGTNSTAQAITDSYISTIRGSSTTEFQQSSPPTGATQLAKKYILHTTMRIPTSDRTPTTVSTKNPLAKSSGNLTAVETKGNFSQTGESTTHMPTVATTGHPQLKTTSPVIEQVTLTPNLKSFIVYEVTPRPTARVKDKVMSNILTPINSQNSNMKMKTKYLSMFKNVHKQKDQAYSAASDEVNLSLETRRSLIAQAKHVHISLTRMNHNFPTRQNATINKAELDKVTQIYKPSPESEETATHRAAVQKDMDDNTRKGIIGGAGGIFTFLLAFTALAIIVKRKRATKNMATQLQPSVTPKNYDDIILAYGSNDSSKGFLNVGFENESVKDFNIDSPPGYNSRYTQQWAGRMMNTWRGLNPIDEGPEIVYMDAKNAASHNIGSSSGKGAKWVNSKSLDDIRNTIRLTQRQFLNRGGFIKKKKNDKESEPFSSSLGALEEDVSDLSTASTSKLSSSQKYSTVNNLSESVSRSDSTVYSNVSPTESQSIIFAGNLSETESYSPYEIVHFQHQDEVAL